MVPGRRNMDPCQVCKRLKHACVDNGPKPNGSCEHCRKTKKTCSYNDRCHYNSFVTFIPLKRHRQTVPSQIKPPAKDAKPTPPAFRLLEQPPACSTTINLRQLNYRTDRIHINQARVESEKIKRDLLEKARDEELSVDELDFVTMIWLAERNNDTSISLDEQLCASYKMVQNLITVQGTLVAKTEEFMELDVIIDV